MTEAQKRHKIATAEYNRAFTKSLLILEDDATSLAVLKAVVEQNYRVTLVRTPEEAIEVCHTEPPDLLISDAGLRSAVSGLETLLSGT